MSTAARGALILNNIKYISQKLQGKTRSNAISHVRVWYTSRVIKEIPKIPKDYCRSYRREWQQGIEKSRLANKFPFRLKYLLEFELQFVSFSPTITTGTHEKERSLGLRDHNCVTLARIPSRYSIYIYAQPIFSTFRYTHAVHFQSYLSLYSAFSL